MASVTGTERRLYTWRGCRLPPVGGAPCGAAVQVLGATAVVPAAPPLPQRGAALGDVWQQLGQDPPQDTLVRWPAPAVAAFCLDVLVNVPQRRVQRLVHGLLRLGPTASLPAAAAPTSRRRRALFPAERHGADQEGQLGHFLLRARALRFGLASAGAATGTALLRVPLVLLARPFPLVAQHGGEAGIGSRAAALAAADEVAVLVSLALAHALVTQVVVVVVVLVALVVMVVGGGTAQALGGGERAVVKVALAAEGRALHLDEVAEVRRHRVLLLAV